MERLARAVRGAADEVQAALDVPFDSLYRPTRSGLGFTLDPADVARRSAWALAGEWLVAASVGASCATDGLAAAHRWFWEGASKDLGHVPGKVRVALDVTRRDELRALMPYLLDPMAAATRRDVLKAHSTAEQRRSRKAAGVYYTPGDVAYFMVGRLADGAASRGHLWLDPAHGSGVFLRAILAATADLPGSREAIYGVDIDPRAAEASSFVLTADDLQRAPGHKPPWQRWHEFRRNLATGDALLIESSAARRQTLDLPASDRPLGHHGPWRIGSAFPETAEVGFGRVVANPPYAPLRSTEGSSHIHDLHPVTGPNASTDVSPVFVELCSNLLNPKGAMAVVLPLSVVASTRKPFPELRQYLAEQHGRLELLSFDRVPDALFGDDIKTRNAIVHLDRDKPSALNASPLHRWTSRSRKNALTDMPITSIAGLQGVPETIPKIGTQWERELLIACGSQSQFLDDWFLGRRSRALTDVTRSIEDDPSDLIAVAPTAYNFLGVMRDPYRAVTEGHDSQSSFSILSFDCDVLASAAFALLSSRLAFWLWHVHGDGFHVTNTLWVRLPVPGDLARLADLGEKLWKAALQSPAISRNRGRTTVAYPTWFQTDLIDRIDAEIGACVDLDYAARLSAWHEHIVVVDLDSKRRNLLQRKIQ